MIGREPASTYGPRSKPVDERGTERQRRGPPVAAAKNSRRIGSQACCRLLPQRAWRRPETPVNAKAQGHRSRARKPSSLDCTLPHTPPEHPPPAQGGRRPEEAHHFPVGPEGTSRGPIASSRMGQGRDPLWGSWLFDAGAFVHHPLASGPLQGPTYIDPDALPPLFYSSLPVSTLSLSFSFSSGTRRKPSLSSSS